MSAFLLLHGWRGSGPEHWQTWLAGELAAAGHDVRYPRLPDAEDPRLGAWLDALDRELAAIDAPDDLTVLAHSLGCILWLHHAAGSPPAVAPIRRVLLNAPPGPLRGLASFFPVPLDAAAVRAAAGLTRVVCSDDDPYNPGGAVRGCVEPLGLPVDVLPGQGHLNADAGYGPWPAMLEWCLGQREALSANGSPPLDAGSGAKNGAET